MRHLPAASLRSNHPSWWWSGMVWLGLAGALVGCGDDKPATAPQAPGSGYQEQRYQGPQVNQWQQGPQGQQPVYAPPVTQVPQWGMPSQQAPAAMPHWPQTQVPSASQPPPAVHYPPAENPWRKPPAGFSRSGQAPQMTWQQAQPAGPQFRPLEQEKSHEYRRSEVQSYAPYDRPIGSSHDRSQPPTWPGYYPGGSGYPGYGGYPAYPAYPGGQSGYWSGMPSPWGMPGMPGAGPMW